MATSTKTEATVSTPSSGNAALDVLFSGGGEGAAGGVQDVAPPTKQNDIGDFGKLGDMPMTPIEGIQGEDGKAQSTTDDSTSVTTEPNWLEFSVTDEQGRRKMKVDLNNKEQLKRLLPQSAGFRKMQAERDKVNEWRKTAEPRLMELESSWQTLETAYQEGGVEGLVDLLGGKAGHYKEWFGSEVAKHQKFVGATEAEKRAMAAEEQVARLTKQQDLREKRAADAEKRAATQNEEAQLRSVEAQVTPVFNKYRMAGTLGNPAAEAAYDQAIWDQALKNLEAMPEDQPLTNAQIETEFRKVSSAFKSAIGKAAGAKTRQVMDEKKAEAQTRVAAAAVRGAPGKAGGTVDQRMTADIRKGGIGGLTDALMHAIRP